MKTETLTIKKPKLTTAPVTAAPNTVRTLKIKNVLVPLDMSPESHAALRFAKPLLRRFGASLHLVHVLPPDLLMSGFADVPLVIPDGDIDERVRRDLSELADAQAVKMQPDHLHVLRGNAFSEICQLAARIDTDLIVMATRGN